MDGRQGLGFFFGQAVSGMIMTNAPGLSSYLYDESGQMHACHVCVYCITGGWAARGGWMGNVARTMAM